MLLRHRTLTNQPNSTHIQNAYAQSPNLISNIITEKRALVYFRRNILQLMKDSLHHQSVFTFSQIIKLLVIPYKNLVSLRQSNNSVTSTTFLISISNFPRKKILKSKNVDKAQKSMEKSKSKNTMVQDILKEALHWYVK